MCHNIDLGDLEPGVDVIYPEMSRRNQRTPIHTFSEETQVGVISERTAQCN